MEGDTEQICRQEGADVCHSDHSPEAVAEDSHEDTPHPLQEDSSQPEIRNEMEGGHAYDNHRRRHGAAEEAGNNHDDPLEVRQAGEEEDTRRHIVSPSREGSDQGHVLHGKIGSP